MADSVSRTVDIWMFGKQKQFRLYDCGVELDATQYSLTGTTPVRKQKNQIVMHYTAGNNAASGAVRYWSTYGPIPFQWICPNYTSTGASKHEWGVNQKYKCPDCARRSNSASWRCPVHRGSEHVSCPLGHGRVVKGRLRASSQYVMELAQNRLTPDDQPYSDVVEVVDSDYVCWHAGVVNEHSIGIEHSNVGWNWAAARHDAFTGTGAAKRPSDANRFFRLQNHDDPDEPHPVAASAQTNLSTRTTDFQAYQEEQYDAMIRLLRYLCITHRIPRQFLGDTTLEKMSRWWHGLPATETQLTRSRLMRFRGILSHQNCHDDKACGGPALHRNRIFRGIIDEWWMPVEMEGNVRPYYMGPFDPQNGERSYVRFHEGIVVEEYFRDTHLDPLQETRSYFDLDRVDMYYAHSEVPSGGFFPLGRNKIWHGGVHFAPPGETPRVFAAASGTIVAARVTCTPEVEAALGSTRFVLIRHAVYMDTEDDPGGGSRTNYTATPKYVFSLYMHLAAIPHPEGAHCDNPPWFNFWRRRNTGDLPEGVFSPTFNETPESETTVEVSVGDWIGNCGNFRDRKLVHFELMTNEEFAMAPWDGQRAEDTDANCIANDATVNEFITDLEGDGVDTADIIRSLPGLRNAKTFHISEWALENADALTPIFSDSAGGREQRDLLWATLQHFMWVRDALGLLPELEGQLCDSNGRCWHYHPVTFMKHVNELVLHENGQVDEPDLTETNVVMQGGFITRFVDFSSGTREAATADDTAVRPYGISSGAQDYTITQAQIACRGTGVHDPVGSPPAATRFSLALLDILTDIQKTYTGGFQVITSHLCNGHSQDNEANLTQCVLGTIDGLRAHAAGLAVDIRPSGATAARCAQFWGAVTAAAQAFSSAAEHHGGEPSHSEQSYVCDTAAVSTVPALQTKLEAETPLTPAECGSFIIHVELSESPVRAIRWKAILRTSSRASRLKIYDGGIIGVYENEGAARADAAAGQGVWEKEWGWETWIRRRSSAIEIELEEGTIFGIYNNEVQAVEEAADGTAQPVGS